MMGGERRSTEGEAATPGPPDAPGGHDRASVTEGWGVGGQAPGLPPGGVGTSVNALPQKFARPRLVGPDYDVRDPRLDELARMGLQRHWLNVAAAIGVDAFLVMWRVLDADQGLWRDPPGTGLLIFMRRYDSFLRYQRNRYIEGLAASGLSSEQIRKIVATNIGENISERHIDRLCKQG